MTWISSETGNPPPQLTLSILLQFDNHIIRVCKNWNGIEI